LIIQLSALYILIIHSVAKRIQIYTASRVKRS
jgi:hypothetical protein